MEKQQLEYLLPYFKYNLSLYLVVREVKCTWTGIELENKIIHSLEMSLLARVKPILMHLDYFNHITTRDAKIEFSMTHNQVMELYCLINGSISLDMISLGLYNALCKNHIDFNRLIEKGLAINKNTL